MNVGSLFSGIGGIDLGLERAGMRVVWQAESDAWCRGILARHWPGVPCYDDVRRLVADADGEPLRVRSGGLEGAQGSPEGEASERERLRADALLGGAGGVPVPVPRVDVLAGGFPCQPVSLAGKGLAQADERWLWPEFARLIRVLRPRYVIAENVPGLLARGLDIVLADLATLRFDAEWTVFGARDVGAPHKRDRVWIVAWDTDPGGARLEGPDERPAEQHEPAGLRDDVAHAESLGWERAGATWTGRDGSPNGCVPMGHADSAPPHALATASPSRHSPSEPGWWAVEPDVGRVAHGIPNRVDRLRALGNAVVPACAEHIGRLVLNHHAQYIRSNPAATTTTKRGTTA